MRPKDQSSGGVGPNPTARVAIGMAVFLSGFANPITRKVCGVADTRLLR